MHRFKELTGEIAFLVRGIFFLLFGFLIDLDDLLNTSATVGALVIVSGILLVRYIFLKSFKMNASPLLWIAPRGLITILLFLSIPVSQTIDAVNQALVIQVILLSALAMMFGLMSQPKKK